MSRRVDDRGFGTGLTIALGIALTGALLALTGRKSMSGTVQPGGQR